MIPHSFWKDVEKPMKYVQYGDSVAGEMYVFCRFKNEYNKNQQFNKIWDILSQTHSIDVINGKEYIQNISNFQILSYIERSETAYFTTPKYLMRHKISKRISKLHLDKDHKLYGDFLVTNDHSMLEYDSKWKTLSKVKPKDLSCALLIDTSNMSQHTSYCHDTEEVDYDGYVYDFEVPETHNFVANGIVVHNTDSLYIALDTDAKDTQEMVDEAESLSKAINDQIIYFTESFLLPKLGVDIEHNHTFFKTELVADAIIFLDIKKNYAFRELANNGKIHDTPSIEYTGIPVVRNNISKFTKDFIRAITEEIALDNTITNSEMKKQLQVVAKKYWERLQTLCGESDFTNIGIPCKWGDNYKKEPFQVIAMRTYNTISKSDAFTPSSSGIVIPVKIKNQSSFTTNIADLKGRNEFCLGLTPIDKINYLALPYNRDREKTKQLLSDFGLTIDIPEYWNVLYNTVARRIVDAIKGAI